MKNQILLASITMVILSMVAGGAVLAQTDEEVECEDGLFLCTASDEEVSGLIQLQDPLDEPEFYCVDVPGFGRNVQLESPLMAHTCKTTRAEDETFTFDAPEAGQLYMAAYDLCAEAGSAEAGSAVNLAECDAEALQLFDFTEDGFIQLVVDDEDVELCLVIADGLGQPTGGPSHLRRDLSLEDCNTVDESLMVWEVPGMLGQ